MSSPTEDDDGLGSYLHRTHVKLLFRRSLQLQTVTGTPPSANRNASKNASFYCR
ncbi:hypothetical protein K523DRAFT_326384 [Schizophyllum commune Tattone D]|nr:hypothetical protein K523DRAFT_326384 [Schizophyllum commune Tattone D]